MADLVSDGAAEQQTEVDARRARLTDEIGEDGRQKRHAPARFTSANPIET